MKDNYTELNSKNEAIAFLNNKTKSLEKSLAHCTGARIYNDGKGNYLLKWQESSAFERPDKTTYEAQCILYFHESGRSALVSIDPTTGLAALCRAPKSGIRMTKEIRDKATEVLTSHLN